MRCGLTFVNGCDPTLQPPLPTPGSALPTATIMQMWGSKEAFVAFYNGAAFKDAKELLLKSAEVSIVLV